MKETLLDKITNKKTAVGIIGLGYVGLPLLLRFVEEGFNVIEFDIDESKVEKLYKGESYFKHIPHGKIKSINPLFFSATTDFSKARNADVLILCVPTPLNKYREPDLSFVTNTVDSLVPFLRKGQLISLESTTYPGTTDEIILPRIEIDGMNIGVDIFLAYSPEREDPGNPQFDTKNIPKVVGGVSKNCLEVAEALYEQVIDKVVPVSSTRTAEMTKLLENIYRAVNIGLVNEMKLVL